MVTDTLRSTSGLWPETIETKTNGKELCRISEIMRPGQRTGSVGSCLFVVKFLLTLIYWKIAAEITSRAEFAESRSYIQHDRISVFEHSLDVARSSFRMGRCLKNMDARAMAAQA
jgi:hypothetical protein